MALSPSPSSSSASSSFHLSRLSPSPPADAGEELFVVLHQVAAILLALPEAQLTK